MERKFLTPGTMKGPLLLHHRPPVTKAECQSEKQVNGVGQCVEKRCVFRRNGEQRK